KPNARGWVIGRGWDQNDWSDQSFPSRQGLDSLFPETPVSLKRIDGHAIFVNEKALQLAGIKPSSSIAGGSIDYERGILVDNAMALVERLIPEYTEAEDAEALMQAQADCFAAGLTTIDDAGLMKSQVDLIKRLHQDGSLKMRIYAMLADDSTNFNHYLKAGIDTSDRLSVRAFKFYADGALGSRGACLLAPYSDVLPNPTFGSMLQPQAYYEQCAAALFAKGFQMCTHAIGDSANRMMLQVYGKVLKGSSDARWRIEHAQVVHQADMPLFQAFHIIPSIQPTHATSDAPWAIFRLGQQRMMRAYAYQSLKKQLGMVALGTDFPVEQISPIRTFYSAVVRKYNSPTGAIQFQPEEALTREEALRGMTIWAALSNFEEQKKGSLEIGKFADLVMLDRDIMECAEDAILGTQVWMTVVGGEVVYRQ
ncbi:MAG: amidohydrolase, partial [Flavobacteriales bacterium]